MIDWRKVNEAMCSGTVGHADPGVIERAIMQALEEYDRQHQRHANPITSNEAWRELYEERDEWKRKHQLAERAYMVMLEALEALGFEGVAASEDLIELERNLKTWVEAQRP